MSKHAEELSVAALWPGLLASRHLRRMKTIERLSVFSLIFLARKEKHAGL